MSGSAKPVSSVLTLLAALLAHLLSSQPQCLGAKGIADAEVICIQSIEQRTHGGDHTFLFRFDQQPHRASDRNPEALGHFACLSVIQAGCVPDS